MYVLVRSDLAPGYQAAQGVHAATYLTAKDPFFLYLHPTVSVLNVGNEEDLVYWASKHVHTKGEPAGMMYHERDLAYEATAFACYTEGSEFATLPLALAK